MTFPHITPKMFLMAPIYWTFFWNAVYALCPPREYFNSPRYNRFLEIVSYYGALNVRGIIMKAYQAPPSAAPPIPPKVDPKP